MYQFCARPFEELEDDGEIIGNFTYVIVAVYFTIFESLIVYRNTRRPVLSIYGRVGAIPT